MITARLKADLRIGFLYHSGGKKEAGNMGTLVPGRYSQIVPVRKQ